jgi:hypothetical protein
MTNLTSRNIIEAVYWIDLAQDREKSWGFANMVMKL